MLSRRRWPISVWGFRRHRHRQRRLDLSILAQPATSTRLATCERRSARAAGNGPRLIGSMRSTGRPRTRDFRVGDLSKYGPEQRAAWAAKFDAAALNDNLAPMEPPSAEMVQARQEFMLPSNPTPADYKPSYGDFAKDKTTEHLGQFNTEMTRWAAAVGFSPEIGTAVIERLVEVAPRLAVMTPEQRAEWVDQQDQIMLQRVGSPQALAELKEQAKKALASRRGTGFRKRPRRPRRSMTLAADDLGQSRARRCWLFGEVWKVMTGEPENWGELGPAMRVLNERQRLFVRALLLEKPGYGSATRAYRKAGYGKTSKAATQSKEAHKMLRDDRIIAAIAEEFKKVIRGIGHAEAVSALLNMIRDRQNIATTPARSI